MTSDSKRGRAPSAPKPAKRPVKPQRKGLGDLLAMDSERSSRLLIIGSVVLVLILAAGFVAFGYWDTVIKPRNRTVVGAEGVNFSYVAMKRRMAYDLRQNPSYAQSQSALVQLPQVAFSEALTEIILLTRGGSDQGIQLDPSDVDTALRIRIGVAADADAKTFADAFRKTLDQSGLHEDEYRRMVQADVIKSKLIEKFTAELPAAVPQSKVSVIQLNTKEDADKALFRVRSGEDFAAVVNDVSTDSTKITNKGTFDYQFEGAMNAAYSGYAFSGAIGEISDVITGGSGDASTYYIVRVEDRADKPYTDAQKPVAAQQRYNQWLGDMKQQLQVKEDWDRQAQGDALVSVLNSVPAPTAAAPVAAGTAVVTTNTPVSADTPVEGATPAEQPSADAGGNNPVAPSAPVAPGDGSVP